MTGFILYPDVPKGSTGIDKRPFSGNFAMRLALGLAWPIAVVACSLQLLCAQDLAPRAYVITPLHANAVTVTWAYYNGGLDLNGAIPVKDAHGTYNVPVVTAYHSFSFFGRSANFNVSLPYAFGNFTGEWDNKQQSRYRSGLLEQASQELAKMPAAAGVVATLAARNDIGLGKKEQGCATAQNAGPIPVDLPKPLKVQAAMISGYCAAISGDQAGAGLAAEMAREEGQKESAGLAALDAISVHASPRIAAT